MGTMIFYQIQGQVLGKIKEVAGWAENQLLHRLFDTPSPWNGNFCKSLIISNNVPMTCVQSVSETFAEKVVQNAVAGMVQRREQQSLALRRKAVSACNCKHYKKKNVRSLFASHWQSESSGGVISRSST